jgi:signal transduction histidine kinase
LELIRGPVDLVTLVRSCTEQLRSQTERHAIRLEIGRARIDGIWDADRLRQVIDNLLSNAIKYSPNDGEIVVRVEAIVSVARVSIRDHGVGIPEDALDRIFDRFYRADGPTTEANGFGIRLFVAKSIVELHEGRIDVTSTPGSGSTFSFTLPVSPQQDDF